MSKRGRWVTVASGYWRTYDSIRIRPGFVEFPRYPTDNDTEARVQVRASRKSKEKKG